MVIRFCCRCCWGGGGDGGIGGCCEACGISRARIGPRLALEVQKRRRGRREKVLVGGG